MATARKSPADMTGFKKAKLAEENAEAIRLREGEISMVTAAAAEEKENGVTDLTQVKPSKAEVTEPEVQDVELVAQTRDFRVNTKIEMMTMGHGTSYDFEEGRTYRTSKALYDRLDELGYVWH